MINNCNYGFNFSKKLLLNNTKVSSFRRAFVNNAFSQCKLSKTQLHKIGKSGGYLGRLLRPLVKTVSPLIKNAL